jgi:cell division protein FtsW
LNKTVRADYYDYSLIAVILLLIGFGLVMLYSTSSYTSSVQYGNDMYFFAKQAGYSAVAIILAVTISLFDYHILARLSGIIYALSLILMVMVKSPLGRTINGARRWLKLGPFSFQPAEMAKIAVLIFLPCMIISMGRNFSNLKGTMTVLGAGLVQAAAAYILTDNLSTAVIIAFITAVIVFVAHPNTRYFLIGALVIAALVAAIVMWIAHAAQAGSFRSMRVLVWLNPEKYSSNGGYQILQGLYALGSGGIFGKGLGNSTQKLGAVPEAQNDMIFSIICEELGVFGGIIIVLLFVYLLYRLFVIAQNAPDLFGTLMVTGIFGHIAAQVIFNIAVALNLIPTTGVTLPFISYGGTSVVFLMLEMAIALSVSRRIKFRQKQRDIWGDLVNTEVRQ